ncbi:MAG: response regulator [Syntrophobacteraceae bacterium]|jgi:CheY-like chemotaxis protein/cytidylate kinase|nr:response regulator [Syntrophobacteraceae bacterium]
MSVIALFSGSHCEADEVARRLVERLGYELVEDSHLVEEARARFEADAGRLMRAMTSKASVFNKFTHEKERSLATIKAALAGKLRQDALLVRGYAAHLIPREISHVLKICLIADMKHRVRRAMEAEGLSEKEAQKQIHRDDESLVLWVEHLFSQKDPWAPQLYDMVIPMDKTPVADGVALIEENIRRDILRVTPESESAVEDFVLAAHVELKLAGAGHCVQVSARNGGVTITINRQVLMLSSLEAELKRIAGAVPGVQSVETKVGPGYYKTDIYRKYDFDLPLPSKVLLVDDEREFVQTLSERLQMRDYGSAVAYDGEEALSILAEEEPEVMVLDLKMPGIDGLEVLRRVRREHPNVEVIVLTGHGSREVERECLELGACAYLEKPVDMETLTARMRDAYRKIRDRDGKA